MRTSALASLLAASIVFLMVMGSPDGRTSGPVEDLVDSATAEMEIGRYWHAARILQPLRESGQLGSEGLLLLATAEAGYRN